MASTFENTLTGRITAIAAQLTLAFFILTASAVRAAEVIAVNPLYGVKGAMVVLEGTSWAFNMNTVTTVDSGNSRIATIKNPPPNQDHYLSANPGTLDTTVYRYVQVFYSLASDFTGSYHQLFLRTSHQTTLRSVPSFLNSTSIPSTSGSHSFIIDLLDGTTSIGTDGYSGNLTLFRWDFWNDNIADNDGKSITLDRIVFASELASAADVPETWVIDTLSQQPFPSRIALLVEDAQSATLVTVMDPDLDLPYQVKNNPLRGGTPGVPFAPEMVVGEGAHPGNHTIVKVLNPYGQADVTFLAYPPAVTGGVQVAAGRTSDNQTVIATSPITDTATREIRLFTKHGGFRGRILPESNPPYVIASGDLLPGNGDELVVCQRTPGAEAKLEIYSFDGTLRKTLDLPADIQGEITLSAKRGIDPAILIFSEQQRTTWIWPLDRQPMAFSHEDLAGKLGVAENAFAQTQLLYMEHDPLVSTLTVADLATRTLTQRNVSQYENRFWIVPKTRALEPDEEPLPNSRMSEFEDGTNVKFCVYAHERMDIRSPGSRNPQFGSDNPSDWIANTSILPLADMPPKMWEPCFTHRHFANVVTNWLPVVDPNSGLFRHQMLSRKNNTDTYYEAGTDFSTLTYALGNQDINHLYLDNLSAYLAKLAVRFRENPERMPSLEPVHEMEIAIHTDDTIGDYNPLMIEGFYHYLVSMYGKGIENLNAIFNTPFSDYFDAPRNTGRGLWDTYDMNNPFFKAWSEYNRFVVNVRIAQSFRESLLAGFPPELIKAHQIPGIYFGGVLSFSDVKNRITPIDYVISSGLGGGYTRYGIWFQNQHNFVQGSFSSGYDSIVVGEYQSNTTDNNLADQQLTYMFENGVNAVHCMVQSQDPKFLETLTYAVYQLLQRDQPRPGPAGGVSDVKAFVDGDRRFNIAALGTGPDKVGLLKSLNADGSWEGSVYVAPFKAHTDISLLREIPQANLQAGQSLEIGPINNFNGGHQIELSFQATGNGSLTFQVCRGDIVLPGLSGTLTLTPEQKHYRIIHRTQVPSDGITLKLSTTGTASITNLSAIRHTPRFANVYRGIFDGERHKGGIRFDVLQTTEQSADPNKNDTVVFFDNFNASDGSATLDLATRQTGYLAPATYSGGTLDNFQYLPGTDKIALDADFTAAFTDPQIDGFKVSFSAANEGTDWISPYMTTHPGDERAVSRFGLLIRSSGDITAYYDGGSEQATAAVDASTLTSLLGSWDVSQMNHYALVATQATTITGTYDVYINGVAVPTLANLAYTFGGGGDNGQINWEHIPTTGGVGRFDNLYASTYIIPPAGTILIIR